MSPVIVVGTMSEVLRYQDLIAVVHGLRDDDRHQAAGVGHLLRIARLQRGECRQKLALAVDESEHIGYIAERQLFIERLLARLLVLTLGLAPDQRLRVLVVLQVRQLALFQLAVERQPLCVQLGPQRVELAIDWLTQERDIHRREHVGLLVQRNQFVGEMAVL
jgi:hypothetical protein